jgi:hypothetical protein
MPLERFMRSPVKIYTVQVFDNEVGRSEWEFTNWKLRHGKIPEIENEYKEVLRWIQIASEGKKDLQRMLRPERKAHAFPPRARFLEVDFTANLRLYCMLIGSRTIILFNGAIKSKTARTAEDCPLVKPFFRFANDACAAIETAIIEGDLTLDYDAGFILKSDDQKIEL